MTTGKGVVLFDAPPSFARHIAQAVAETTKEPIVELVYSHAHIDPIGGAGMLFAAYPKLKIVGEAGTAEFLHDMKDARRPVPTEIFQDHEVLTLGTMHADMQVRHWHSNDGAMLINFPAERVVIAIDALSSGAVPFMNFDLTMKGQVSSRIDRPGCIPRPLQPTVPVWLGLGGTPQTFERAGSLGLPLMVAIIGGSPDYFARLVELYRESALRAGFSEADTKVGVHAFGYCAETDQQAADKFFPGYAQGTNKIGKERGWATITRSSFDTLLSQRGALVIGSPQTVADKIRHFDPGAWRSGRFTFQTSPAAVQHEKLLTATRLIGTRVKPMLQDSSS